MIASWIDFCEIFGLGLGLGLSVGLLSLAIRRVRYTLERGFRSAMGSGF